jgi:hypothetical protein
MSHKKGLHVFQALNTENGSCDLKQKSNPLSVPSAIVWEVITRMVPLSIPFFWLDNTFMYLTITDHEHFFVLFFINEQNINIVSQ